MARTARLALQETKGTEGSFLPAAVNADLEARVHHMVLAVPYIRRDEEEAMRAHMRAGRPVLLIGTSMVGKTKTAARVIVEEFGSWPVAVPDSKTALADLDSKDISLHDSVIWLDDIDRLIGNGGITDGALRRLIAAGNVVVGTIRAGAYEQFRPSDQIRPPEWDVLRVFERVFISRDLSEKEKERLAAAVEDSAIRDRIDAVGLGEYVGAAGQVTETLKLGATNPDSLGYALVLGAADWRRCGMNRPIPISVLTSLAAHHLDQQRRHRLADQDAFNAGVSWATREISPGVSLLRSVAENSYVIYDYALDLISAEGKSIPDANWSVIIASADDPELIRLGHGANAFDDLSDTARQSFTNAAGSGHPGVAPMATFSLGSKLEKQGMPEGAKTAFRRAIDSGYSPATPMAAINLGMLLLSEGDTGGAETAFRQAIDSDEISLAAKAASNLGVVLKGRGDTEGAEAFFRKAIDFEDADEAAAAAANLGVLLKDKGDAEGAKTAYRQAMNFGAAPMAAFGLGLLLEDEGDSAGAIAAFRQAIDSGDAGAAPMAAFSLGLLLQQAEDAVGAKAAYQQAIDSGHADEASKAAVNLGTLLHAEGNAEGAIAAYRKVVHSGHPAAPIAAINLAVVLKELGDFEGAKAAYRQAADSGDAEVSAAARRFLDDLPKERS